MSQTYEPQPGDKLKIIPTDWADKKYWGDIVTVTEVVRKDGEIKLIRVLTHDNVEATGILGCFEPVEA